MAERQKLDGFALVTGAASGIGHETAFAFAESGCAGVAFADVNEEAATKAAEESKKYATNTEYRAITIKVDVADWKSVQAMVSRAVEEFGRIDYNVNCAGVPPRAFAMTADVDFEDFERVIGVNMKGVAHCVSAVARVMQKQEPKTYSAPANSVRARHEPRSLGRGSIVNLGSSHSFTTLVAHFPYTTSKHGVVGITKMAALDHAADEIRINAVCPGPVDTPMMQGAIAAVPAIKDNFKRMIPLWPRMASPDEVADVVMFLCSPGASYITGVAHLVDAGIALGPPPPRP